MDIGKNLQQSFDLYIKNFVTLFLACLVAGILSVITLGILAGPLFGGVLMLCFKLLANEKGEVGGIFNHFDKFLPAFLLTLMLWAASLAIWIISSIPFIGWILQIIAAPTIAFIYFMSLAYIMEKNMKPMEAIRLSIDKFASNPMIIWVYALILGILSGIGAILYVIGIVLTLPLGIIGYAVAYKNISILETAAFEPEKQKLRIAGIVLAVLILVGLAFMLVGKSHKSSNRVGAGIASRILSFGTGQNVKVDASGESMSIGNLNFGKGLPKDFPKDIPIYPNAEVGGYMSGKNDDMDGATVTFTSKDKPAKIYDFYMDKLTDWQVETNQIGEMRMINMTQGTRNAAITINPGDDKTDIIIVIARE